MHHLNPLFKASPEISRFVNIQMGIDVNRRLMVVRDYLHRADILLDMLLETDAHCNGQTFQKLLPKMSALAQGILDHMHLATNITKSLLDLSAYDLEYPSGKKISGPHTLKALNFDLWGLIQTAYLDLDAASVDLKGIRDTAHHVDERLNGKAGTKRKNIQSDEAINIGCFVRGEALTMQSTAVLNRSPLETIDTIPCYIARVELSKTALREHSEKIRKVFSCFPYTEPLPDLLKPLHDY